MARRVGLALSGGGAKGAFTVGVLKVLRQKYLLDTFPVISGTSTGSLIGSMLATNKWAALVDIYSNVTTKNIVNPNHALLAGIAGTEAVLLAQAITGGKAIFNSSALEETIRLNVDFAGIDADKAKTLLIFNTVDLQTGDTVAFNNREHTPAQMARGLLASANMPVLTDPVPIDAFGTKHQYVDGGVREYLPISAIFDSGEPLDAIVAIATSPLGAEGHGGTYGKITDILKRTIDLLGTEVGENDFGGCCQFNAMLRMIRNAQANGLSRDLLLDGIPDQVAEALGDKRDVEVIFVAPEQPLGMEPLEFDPPVMRKAMDIGTKRALKVLKDVDLS